MSPAEAFLRRLTAVFGKRAHDVLDGLLAELTIAMIAALVWDWSWWARPNQLIPSTPFRTFGFQSGRGWGKSISNIKFLLEQVDAGIARRIALVGPNELKAIEVFVTGSSGILSVSPPWLAPEWSSSTNTIRFANGAIATIYSAEAPDSLRGPEHDLALATEICAWPASTRDEAFSNLRRGLRLGRGQLVWDSTPRRRNALMRHLLAECKADPARHIVVRGSSSENSANLARGVIEDWQREIGGTHRGAEELEGIYFDETEDALFKQVWIDRARRPMPASFKRKVLALDPAISTRANSDNTGIVELGLGLDDQIHVLANLTGKYTAGEWPGLVIERYVQSGCSLIVIETNRGADALPQLLKDAAKARNQNVVLIGDKSMAPPAHPGTIYVRPIHARGQKAERAEGVSGALEKGRISFVIGGQYGDLEDRLCLFDGRPGGDDDAVDAFVHGVTELVPTGAVPPARIPRAFSSPFTNTQSPALGTPSASWRKGPFQPW